jgi:hypothetical protein
MTKLGDWEKLSLDYWRMCDALTLPQAAVLIVGGDPSEGPGHRLSGFKVGYTALVHAVRGNRLAAELSEDVEGGVDFDHTTILVEDLRAWLKSRGFISGFFFPEPQGPGYLLRSHPNYSPKLQAAISA